MCQPAGFWQRITPSFANCPVEYCWPNMAGSDMSGGFRCEGKGGVTGALINKKGARISPHPLNFKNFKTGLLLKFLAV
jgi:hypothetical protein